MFCLPHAGAGGAAFRKWSESAPLDLAFVRLPGRESRIDEPPFITADTAVEALADALDSEWRAPFALFGHCLGALLAFELAAALERRGLRPLFLAVAGRGAPQPVASSGGRISQLPDDAFLAAVAAGGGIPDSVLLAPEMVELILPALRADFRIAETYECEPGRKLSCPIIAVSAGDESAETRAQVAGWAALTTAEFHLRVIDPDPSFPCQPSRDLLEAILDAAKGFISQVATD